MFNKGELGSTPRKPNNWDARSFSQGKKNKKTSRLLQRKTYQGRTTRGRAGAFSENEKILIRYNKKNDFDFSYLDKMLKAIVNTPKYMVAMTQQALALGADVAQVALLKYTPKDTGRLVKSFKVTVTRKGTIKITSDSPYANAQNYGKYGQENGKIMGKKVYAWYPGYYFYEKSAHEAVIAMREYVRNANRKIKNKVENGQ